MSPRCPLYGENRGWFLWPWIQTVVLENGLSSCGPYLQPAPSIKPCIAPRQLGTRLAWTMRGRKPQHRTCGHRITRTSVSQWILLLKIRQITKTQNVRSSSARWRKDAFLRPVMWPVNSWLRFLFLVTAVGSCKQYRDLWIGKGSDVAIMAHLQVPAQLSRSYWVKWERRDISVHTETRMQAGVPESAGFYSKHEQQIFLFSVCPYRLGGSP
jgi:hypothetical protein